MSGWIRLHRALSDHDIWKAERFTYGQAWVDLLMLAQWKTGKIQKRGVWISLEPGQVGWSMDALAKRWMWSRGKVKRFLNELETVQQIVQQKNNVTSIITITNWDRYQSDGTADGTADGHQTIQQTNTKRYRNNKDKKDKKDKNTYRAFDHLSLSVAEYEKLIDSGWTEKEVNHYCDQVQNYAKNKKYKSLNLTIKNWRKRDKDKEASEIEDIHGGMEMSVEELMEVIDNAVANDAGLQEESDGQREAREAFDKFVGGRARKTVATDQNTIPNAG